MRHIRAQDIETALATAQQNLDVAELSSAHDINNLKESLTLRAALLSDWVEQAGDNVSEATLAGSLANARQTAIKSIRRDSSKAEIKEREINIEFTVLSKALDIYDQFTAAVQALNTQTRNSGLQ